MYGPLWLVFFTLAKCFQGSSLLGPVSVPRSLIRSHNIPLDGYEMQILEPHPSLTKSETLESTSFPQSVFWQALQVTQVHLWVESHGCKVGGRGAWAAEVGLVGLGVDFCLHFKDNGKFLEGF